MIIIIKTVAEEMSVGFYLFILSKWVGDQGLHLVALYLCDSCKCTISKIIVKIKLKKKEKKKKKKSKYIFLIYFRKK